MKNLLLAFAFIGFMSSSSFATKTIVKSNSTEVYGDDKKCDKKDCKHDTKECKSYKKDSAKETKSSCAMKGDAKKACCSADKAKTCDKDKAPAKKDNKDSK